MIELVIKKYLEEALKEKVYLEHDTGGSSQYLIIEKTGSGMRNYLCSSTVIIQSYAPSLYEAACLNERVKEAMLQIMTLCDIASVELNSDYNFTDTQTKQYRYQAVFDLKHY